MPRKRKFLGVESEGASLVRSPMKDWDPRYEAMTSSERQDVEQFAYDMAQAYTRLAEYLSTRNIGGNHGGAVVSQNRTIARVRKALGFSYPHQNITF